MFSLTTELGNVLLLQAPVPGAHNRMVAKSSAIAPLGLGYIAAVLLRDGFDVRICDMDVEDIGVSELEEVLDVFRPAVVGISCTTLTMKNALRVAKVVKQVLPGAMTCIGGPHATVSPGDALKYPFVDAVVRGEGELTFLEVCRSVADGKKWPFEVAGTVWRSERAPLVMPPRPRISDLDSLPYPARHLMPLHLYKIPGTVVTSRGCPFSCGFCAGPTVLGRIYKQRAPSDVVDEMQTCIDFFGLTSFYFVDDTMTYDTQRALGLCEEMMRLQVPPKLGRQLKWTCESRANAVTPQLLIAMHEAGCTTIQFGMESGSQKLLDALGKGVTVYEIEHAVVAARAAGISPVLSMVFPHPDETEATLRETCDFIRHLYDLGAEKVIPALLTLFPGTRFMEERLDLGLNLLVDDTDEYNLGTPLLTTRHLDADAISNGYSQLLLLTQMMGGTEVGGTQIEERVRPLPHDAP